MSAVTIPLETYAADIRALHEEAQDSADKATKLALRAGELLVKVKEQLPHGTFGTWVADNCSIAERTAQAYMRLHRQFEALPEEEAQRVAGLSIRAAIKAVTAGDVPEPPAKSPALMDSRASTRDVRDARITTALSCLKMLPRTARQGVRRGDLDKYRRHAQTILDTLNEMEADAIALGEGKDGFISGDAE